MNVQLIHPIAPLPEHPQASGAVPAAGASFARTFAAALDSVAADLSRADAATIAAAGGGGSIERAAVERARADVELQLAAVATSRACGALNQLLQTQV